MKKLKIYNLMALLGLFVVTGCNNEAPKDTTPTDDKGEKEPSKEEEKTPEPTPEEKEEPITIECLKDALKYISEKKNYTISHQTATSGKEYFTFEEKAIGRYATQKQSALSAYIEDDNGVYHLGYDEGYRSGVYLKNNDGENVKSVWDKKVSPNLFGLGTSIIKKLTEESEAVVFTDKEYKMNFIKMVGYTDADYVNLNSFSANFVNGSLVFAINMEGEGKSNFYYLEKVGSTENEDVHTFLEMGKGAFTPTEKQLAFKRLIEGNNYIRKMYDISQGKYGGIEVFTDKYFYTEMTGAGQGSGCISLVQAPNEDHPTVALKGCYFYTAYGSYENGLRNGSINSNPYNDNPDITKVYHYPSYLKLLSAMEFMKEGSAEGSNYTPSQRGEMYHIDNQEMLTDFINNFSLHQTYDPSVFTPLSFEVDIMVGANDESSQIMFVYNFLYNNVTYSDFLPFSSFGTAKIKYLEDIYEKYND